MKLLLADDDQEIQGFIRTGFNDAGHEIDIAGDGKEALLLTTSKEYDVLIIDRMMPHLDGIKLIETIRKQENHVPIIILSALGEIDDKITGLKSGSDDYLTKPFSFEELLLRTEILYRRTSQQDKPDTLLESGELSLDMISHEVCYDNKKLTLQTKEYQLLLYLLQHKNQVVSRTMILEQVWDYQFDPQTNVIDVHISRLRNKIDSKNKEAVIKTVRGYGYTIKDTA